MRSTMRIWRAALIGVCAACAATPKWAPVQSGALDERGKAQLQTATAAKDALYKALVAELSQELTANGPASAIEVCAERAPVIAREVGEQHGVRIGRSSWKLRNPQNRAPGWAAAAVEARNPEPRQFRGPGGALGVTLPITMQSACLACHGDTSQLDPAVRAALAQRYPQDQATGFAVGDLRGWFWIEVP